MNAASMLKANQTQTPNGTALNASQMLGMGGAPGNELQDQMAEELKKRKLEQQIGAGMGSAALGGAAASLFGSAR